MKLVALLGRDGLDAERHNMLHPGEEPHVPYVAAALNGHPGPVVAASDYVKAFVEQIEPFVDRPFRALGTDGFGRSDTRKRLRAFFEVDRRWVALAALQVLADEGTIPRERVAEALAKYDISANKPNPVTV